MSLVSEFREFAVKGNVVDLAVGVIIGAAFGGFVTAVTKGIVEPIINTLGGKPDVSLKLWIFDAGMVINSLISLLITGLILFFIFVKPMNKLKAMTAKQEAATPPAPGAEEKLLTEIRDLLKQK